MRHTNDTAVRASSYFAFTKVRYAGRYYRAYHEDESRLTGRYKAR